MVGSRNEETVLEGRHWTPGGAGGGGHVRAGRQRKNQPHRLLGSSQEVNWPAPEVKVVVGKLSLWWAERYGG